MKANLTLIKGARQSGKSTYIVNNLKGSCYVISPNTGMAKRLQELYIKHNQKMDMRVTRRVVTTPKALCLFSSVNSIWAMVHPRVDVIWVDEISLISKEGLYNVVKYAQKWDIPLFCTFTPDIVNTSEANDIGWLNIGQWYDTDVQFLDLGLPIDKRLTETLKNYELGEFVLGD